MSTWADEKDLTGPGSTWSSVRAIEAPPVAECRPMTDDKEQRYQAEITRLRGEVESLARSGVENAKRYAADIAAERAWRAEIIARADALAGVP